MNNLRWKREEKPSGAFEAVMAGLLLFIILFSHVIIGEERMERRIEHTQGEKHGD